MITDTGDQIFCTDQSSAWCIYENYAILHPGNRFFIYHMMRFRCKRTVQTDQITDCQQSVQRNIFQSGAFVWIKIISNDFHPKSLTDSCHCKTNLSGTYDPGCFSIQINSHEPIQWEVIFSAFDICFMGMTICGKYQRHSVFGNCLGGISGNTKNFYATFCSFVQVYIIISCTAHQYQSYSLMSQFFNDFCSEICIYKRTDSIVSCGQRCSFFI